MRALGALVVAVVAALVASPSGATGSSAPVQSRGTLEAAVVHELNRARSARGLSPLRVEPSLRAVARGHSRAMLQHGFFGHDSRDGTSFSDRVGRRYSATGWSSWSVGETLLAGRGGDVGAREVVASWLASPPHRRVVLLPAWRDVGIGAFSSAAAPGVFDDMQAVVVTADFGVRAGRAALP